MCKKYKKPVPMTRDMKLTVSVKLEDVNEYTAHDLLRQRLFIQAGLQATGELMIRKYIPGLDELKESQWSVNFLNAMRYRLVMGGVRYGLMHDKRKPKYNRIASIQKRLDKFKDDRNSEHLVDIANEALLIFTEECGDTIGRSHDDAEHTAEVKHDGF